MDAQDWPRFVQFPPFPQQWADLGLSDDDLRLLEFSIAENPDAGAVVPGGHGLRKMRFRPLRSNKGKSGSLRVFYVSYRQFGMVVFWAVLAKNEKADLTEPELAAIARLIGAIRAELDKGTIR